MNGQKTVVFSKNRKAIDETIEFLSEKKVQHHLNNQDEHGIYLSFYSYVDGLEVAVGSTSLMLLVDNEIIDTKGNNVLSFEDISVIYSKTSMSTVSGFPIDEFFTEPEQLKATNKLHMTEVDGIMVLDWKTVMDAYRYIKDHDGKQYNTIRYVGKIEFRFDDNRIAVFHVAAGYVLFGRRQGAMTEEKTMSNIKAMFELKETEVMNIMLYVDKYHHENANPHYYMRLIEYRVPEIYVSALLYCETRFNLMMVSVDELKKALREMGYTKHDIYNNRPVEFVWYWYARCQSIRSDEKFVKLLEELKERGIFKGTNFGENFEQFIGEVADGVEDIAVRPYWLYRHTSIGSNREQWFIDDFRKKTKVISKHSRGQLLEMFDEIAGDWLNKLHEQGKGQISNKGNKRFYPQSIVNDAVNLSRTTRSRWVKKYQKGTNEQVTQ